jgi:phosphatidylserine/phosphatidylglycerophosphate/cardiolipin synthase-like enzyme
MKIIPLINSHLFKSCVLDILTIAEAEDEIIANYFSIRNDSMGLTFLHHLYQAAVRGARVRLILDDYACLHEAREGTEYHSPPIDYEALLCLEEAGVEIYNYHEIESSDMFHRSNLRNWKNFSRRNHNKNFLFNLKKIKKRGLIIGDSQWVEEHFNGSMLGSNVYIEDQDTYLDAYTYIYKLLKSKHVQKLRFGKLRRDFCLQYRSQFDSPCDLSLKAWSWYQENSIIRPKAIRFVYSDIEFQKPAKRHSIQYYEIDLLRRAQKAVWYCTPYFSPDDQLQESFLHVQQTQGVDLNIFIGKYKHDPYLPFGVRKVAKRLLRYGTHIYEYAGEGNIHYKDMVVDDYVFIKTANGEGRSRFYNLETGVIIKSDKFANVIKNKIADDLKKSVKVEACTNFLEEQTFWNKVKGLTLCPLYFRHL